MSRTIAFVIYHLGRGAGGAGGAERVMSNMATFWVERGWQVHIITMDSSEPFHPLDSRVTHHKLTLASESGGGVEAIRQNFRRIGAIRRLLREIKPDAAISFIHQNNIRTLLAARGLGIPVLVSERNDPFSEKLPRLWERLRLVTYPWASRIVLQTERSRAFFPTAIQANCVVIPNPILAQNHVRTLTSGPKVVLGVGRLVDQKGFDLLIDAFSLLAPKFPDWNLLIYGEGNQRAALEAQVARLGLGERVSLPGRTTEPAQSMTDCDLFVMSSRHEGFPNALCEAMACGAASISFDCPNGPGEIIRDGVDGLLVPAEDSKALAAAMERLMADASLRSSLGAEARTVSDRFSVAQIMGMWEREIDSVTGV